jgi:hypothetical protein
MAPLVVNALREWRLACPRGKLDLVFPNGSSNVESHANIASRGVTCRNTMAPPVLAQRARPVSDMLLIGDLIPRLTRPQQPERHGATCRRRNGCPL